jgi:hypothetical protein
MSCTITGAKVEATVSFVNAPRADKRTRGRWNVFKRAESIGQLDLSGAVLVIAFFLSFFFLSFAFLVLSSEHCSSKHQVRYLSVY